MKTKTINWTTIEEQLYDAIMTFERQRALATDGHGCGQWRYLRAYLEQDGTIRVHDGMEASPCYPESEYYSRGLHPVTFRSVSEHYSPSPDDGPEWDDDPEGEYLRDTDATEWKSYYALSDEHREYLLSIGWVRFTLSETTLADDNALHEHVSELTQDAILCTCPL